MKSDYKQLNMRLTDERLAQIRRVLGSCSLESDSVPTMADELDGHIRALEMEIVILKDRLLREQTVSHSRVRIL